MKSPCIIETPRLLLRPIEVQDFEGVCLLDMDPEVRRFFPEGPLQSVDQVQRDIARHLLAWEETGFGIFAVILKDTQQFIGRAGFAQLNDGVVEMGYLILQSHWGQGYATETAKALLAWARSHVPVDRIVGFAPRAHSASIRVLEKSGMIFERFGFYQNIACAYYYFPNQ